MSSTNLAPAPFHRPPLAVRHKHTKELLLETPQPEYVYRSRDLVSYQGDELVAPHLCYEIVEYADLHGGDFSGLFLYNAVFIHCHFAGADFSGAHFLNTAFIGCRDLDDAAGLDGVEHDGYSVLDAQTLRKCVARLPDIFLTGIGYTAEEMATLRTLYPARQNRAAANSAQNNPAFRSAE